MTTQKIKYVCTSCGSDNVTCDASASWNVELQAWEICGGYDNTDCQECAGECGTEEVPADAVCISKYEQMARARGWESDDEPGEHDAIPFRLGVKVYSWADACSRDNLTLDGYEFEMKRSREPV